MNPKYDIYEEIDRYLNEELSEAELVQFNQKLSNDAEFKSIVEAQKIANEVIIDQEMIKLKARMNKEMNADNTGSGPWGKIIIFSAVVVTSAALYSYINHSTSDAEGTKVIAVTTPTQTITPAEKNQTDVSIAPVEQHNTTPQTSTTVDAKNTPVDATPSIEVKTEAVVAVKETATTSVTTSQKEEVKQAVEAAHQIAKVNCETVHISAQVRVDYGFDSDGEATIIIDQLSVKGGTAPYSYALEQAAFDHATRFDGMKDGIYHVRVKDHNGCVSQVKKEVIVKTPAKEIDEAFAPVHGEKWKFPVKANADANLTIFNKAGSLVYSTSISGGHPEEWDGKNNSGVELESGNYYFVIQYNPRDVVKGHISIVK